MSNLGIGVDIESVNRFEDFKNKNNRFLTKIFNKSEIQYCFSKVKPSQHLAARFAAKEAIIKAINSIFEDFPTLNEIEIKNDQKGKPYVLIHKKKFSSVNTKISLSHNKDIAIAFVVIRSELPKKEVLIEKN